MKNFLKWLIAIALMICAVLFLDIDCAFKKFLGIPCFFCGTTRAVINAVNLNVIDAFYWHPLFWFSVMMAFFVIIRFGRPIKSKRIKKMLIITVVACYLSVYAVRMFLLFPSTAPMNVNSDAVWFSFTQTVLRFVGINV